VSGRERRLGPLGRATLASEILRTYVVVRRLLARRPLPEAVAALRRAGAPARPVDAESLALGRHLAWATVRTISILPTDSRCLMRSLVLTRVMARRGLDCTLVLSAAADPSFEAHAWVEHGGEPLLMPGGPTHRQLLRL
jgi:hypothetical protein